MALPLAPPLDQRNAAHLAQQVALLLAHYLPDWPGVRIETDGAGQRTAVVEDPQARALIAVFARYGELIIERLNRAPQKHLLAFLDLLGASLAPPQPARVPLAFRLAEGGGLAARVPAGTQVASAAPAADGAPVIFETERDLVVAPVRLAAAIVHDPATDRYRDIVEIAARRVDGGLPAFEADTPMPHEFYVDIEPFCTVERFDSLQLFLEFDLAAVPTPLPLAWDVWDGAAGIAVPVSDGSTQMSHWGSFGFRDLLPPPRCSAGGASGRWLRCRLTAPVPPQQLPGPFSGMRIETSTQCKGVAFEHACCDAQVLDAGRPFHPFGERPRYGSTFYLASSLLAQVGPGAGVTLTIVTVDPKSYVAETPGLQTIPAQRARPKLAWEAWDGRHWQPLTLGADGTDALTHGGAITLYTLPYDRPMRRGSVNGIEGWWLRARIAEGDYGREAVYQPVKDGADKVIGYKVEPATLVPPVILGPVIDATLGPGGTVRRAVAHNQLRHQLHEVSDAGIAAGQAPRFRPFEFHAAERPALYLGFERPAGGSWADGAVSMHAAVAAPAAGAAAEPDAAPPQLAWEHAGAGGWSGLIARDDTRACTRSGALEWMPPEGFTDIDVFGERPLHWIRARWSAGRWRTPPRLERLLVNAVSALQCVTIADEVLGSGDGGTSQRYACSHAPVFAGTRLQVREPERPSALELEALRGAELEPGSGSEVWVPWLEVADFHASGPRDRHYVLDSLHGEVRFGDGAHGLAPPRGSGNIRLARYRSGGGARGNLPEHGVTQLLTTIPYVDGVTNPLPAEGGADAETLAALLERAPRSVRHGDRAVTREDHEDLALLASTEVARVKCVPLWDAQATPLLADPADRKPGCLTLIVVPRSADPKPMPSRELVERVRSHLDARRLATATLSIVGPRYLQVDVDAEVVPASLQAAGGLEGTVARALAAFLHPLTGGADGSGWPWGRRPHESDFYRCIGAVPGVDHVHSLSVTERPEIQDLTRTDHFLVHSGAHRVRLRAAA